jgi:hypothetical protein
MPFVFYNSSSVGGQLSLVASDQTNVALELRDVPAPPAVDIGYTPADALAWGVPPPDDVAEALDDLASSGRAGIASLTGLAGSTPGFVADTAAVVTPVKSGRFLMFWQVSGTATGVTPSSLLCRFRIDGVEQPVSTGAVVNLREPGTGIFAASVASLITMDRTVSHTVGVNFTFANGSLSNSLMRVAWWEV